MPTRDERTGSAGQVGRGQGRPAGMGTGRAKGWVDQVGLRNRQRDKEHTVGLWGGRRSGEREVCLRDEGDKAEERDLTVDWVGIGKGGGEGGRDEDAPMGPGATPATRMP